MRGIRTTIAVGDESARNHGQDDKTEKPRSGVTTSCVARLVAPLRGFARIDSDPWVPRRLVTHGYCCSDAAHPRVRLLVIPLLRRGTIRLGLRPVHHIPPR